MLSTNLNISTILIIALLFLIVLLGGYITFFLKRQLSEITSQESVPALKSRASLDNCQENTFKVVPEAIVILNPENKFTYLNPAAEEMLGCQLRRVMGSGYSSVFTFLNSKTKRTLQGILVNDTAQKSDLLSRECLLQVDKNHTFPIELIVVPLRMDDDDDDYSLLVLKNISEKKALQSMLSNLETYDGLTRLLNRNSFEAKIKQLVDNAHKHNSKHVLAYFSIDQFQDINNSVGHENSEKLIKTMADLIKSHINKPLDIVGKVGINEFAVVFSDSKVSPAIHSINATIDDVAEYEFNPRGKQYSLSMSAGFVVIGNKTTSAARAISEANIACNLATNKGGSRLSAYKAESADIQKLEGNIEWRTILRKALKENRFRMHAQPIHPLSQEEYKKPFYHYELLIRLADEKGNPIPTDEFISAAEYYSMMPALDRWVIKHVLNKISKIPEQIPLPLFAINMSGQSLNDSTFLDFVLNEIKVSGVHPQMLCFEITEQVAVEDLSVVNKLISSLQSLGCKLSLDDFGTGMSSYTYLKELNVDYLKIDGSFVKNIANDEVAKAMVQSINQVGHTMNLKVIAEYAENKQIMNLLREIGVDYGQGYGIGRPEPMDSAIRHHMIRSPTTQF